MGEAMKRIASVLLVVLAVAVGAYYAYSHFEGEAKKRERQKVEDATDVERQKSVQAELTKMTSKFGAIEDWGKQLNEKEGSSKDDFKRFRIFTIELEELWLTDKPILFKGRIKDIYSLDRNTYAVWLSLYRQSDSETQLALSLECPKTMIDSFLSAHPVKSLTHSFQSEVAVIAKINKIGRSWHRNECVDSYDNLNVEEKQTKVGFGQCLDIMFIGGPFEVIAP